MISLKRVRDEARDLLELIVVPGLAAVLPWSLCFRVFRGLSRWTFLYRDACNEALAHAQRLGFVSDPVQWQRQRRLVTLIDHADFFLATTRSDRWLRRHVVVQGRWPAAEAAGVLCTFHWGAGMWGLRHARASGLRAHALVAPHRPELFSGRSVRFWYFGQRNAVVARTLGRKPIEVSRNLRPVLQALRANDQVLAAVDVPSDQVATSESIDFLGLRARVPRGLLRLAVDSRVPVTVYLTGIRLTDGRRMLSIHQLGRAESVEKLVSDTFALLQEAVRADPAAWHFWEVAPRFFEPASASASSSAQRVD